MNTEKDKQKVTVVLPVAIITQLKQVADKHHRSMNAELLVALEQYLEMQERQGKK